MSLLWCFVVFVSRMDFHYSSFQSNLRSLCPANRGSLKGCLCNFQSSVISLLFLLSVGINSLTQDSRNVNNRVN